MWTWYTVTQPPLPQTVNMAKIFNKEKSYKKYLESQCSDQWRKHLELTLSDPPGRVRAYVHWHLHNKHKRSMYRIPAKKWGDTEIAERGRSVLVMRAHYRSAGLTPHQRGWTDAG